MILQTNHHHHHLHYHHHHQQTGAIIVYDAKDLVPAVEGRERIAVVQLEVDQIELKADSLIQKRRDN